jgi:hypothetical protein
MKGLVFIFYLPREDFLAVRGAWVTVCRVGAPVFC